MENKTNIWMIGSWKLHPHLYEARNSNERISIKPRLMRLLVFLLTNANTIVTKEQIYEAVWPGRIVSEDSLSKCISDLRKIIKQHFSPALKIETFRHVGYQLHADQDVKNGEESPVPLLQLSSTSQSWSKLSYIILAAMILLVSTSFWLLRTPDLETRPYHDLPISPVLTSKANEIDVSSSPDGKLLAYSKEENDVFGIYVKAIDQTGARLVSSSDYAVKQFPSWSADGTTLAYNCVDKDGLSWKTIDLKDGEEKTITTMKAYRHTGTMHWSPEGRYLAKSIKPTLESPFVIMAYDFHTQQTTPITSPNPSFFGDAYPIFINEQQLVFIRFEKTRTSKVNRFQAEQGTIYLKDLASGKLKVIRQFEGTISGLSWDSHSERLFCLVREEDQQTSVYELCLSGTAKLLKEERNVWRRNLTYNDATKTLLFERWEMPLDLQRILPIDTKEKGLANRQGIPELNSSHWDWGISFAREGNLASFISDRSGWDELYAWHPQQSGRIQQLTKLRGPTVLYAQLSPDGSKLLFQQYWQKSYSLQWLDLSTGSITTLVSSDQAISYPTWHPNGQEILYSHHTGQGYELFSLNLSQKQPRQITTDGGYKSQFSVKDGRPTLFYSKFGQAGIYQKHTYAAKEEIAFPDSAVQNYSSWTIGEAGIFFCQDYTIHFISHDLSNRRQVNRYSSYSHLTELVLSPEEAELFISIPHALNIDVEELALHPHPE